ncbi:ribonuclease H-like domain-containing protein [Tanacetum coccineum]
MFIALLFVNVVFTGYYSSTLLFIEYCSSTLLFIEKKLIHMASRDQQWYMDTGATSHLSSHTGNLHTSSLNRNFHSIIVGNGSSIPVTHSGHVQILNPYRPLHLRNVLVTPNIIKNLVSVRKFTTDNKCSIDFDPYGFTIQDYHTCQTLLRCDSTGDLYPLHVAASAFALLTNNHSLWHQRLGHPGDAVIHTLSSRGLVSYIKQNTQHLCRASSSTSLLQRIISLLHAEFAMTDLGPLNYFLGISVTRTTSSIFLSQTKYATEILEQAHMLNCNPCRTPIDTEKKLGPEGSPVTDPTLYRSLAGSLQYLTFTRPDLSYAVQQLCLYMHDPRESHLNAMKRVLRYLRGTTDLGLQLFRSTISQLIAYSDADWDTLSRSSAEAEYGGVVNVVAKTSWIRNLLRELHTPLFTATLVYCDNVSAVYMSANPVQHPRTKHIEIDIHFFRDKVAACHVRVLHVPFRFQYADIFTKGLPYPLFADFRSSLSVHKTPAPTVGAY